MLNTRRLLGGMLAVLRGGSATVTAPTEPAEPRLLAKGTMTHRSFLLVMAALLALGTGACSDSGRPPLSPTPAYATPTPTTPVPTTATTRIITVVPGQNCCSFTEQLNSFLSTRRYFSITNSGNSPLTWTSILLNGQPRGRTDPKGYCTSIAFGVTAWCVWHDGGLVKGGTVPAGGTSAGILHVSFTPREVGTHILSLRVMSDATSGNDTLLITGNVTP